MISRKFALLLCAVGFVACVEPPFALGQDLVPPEEGPAGPLVGLGSASASASDALGAGAGVDEGEWVGRGPRWSEWSRMTGDWNRTRSRLETRGLSFNLGTRTDVAGSGGSAGAASVGMFLIDAGLDLDLEKAGVGRGHVVARYQQKGGGDGVRCAAVAQSFSNIDTADFRGLVELYYERSVGAKARVKVGLNDANAEFAYVQNGAEFLNASMGFSPSISPLSTYPDPHFGVVVQTNPTGWLYAGGGVYNGGPSVGGRDFRALFAIGEAGTRWTAFGGGRVGVGFWSLRSVGRNDPGRDVASGGQYLVLDQTLWSDGNAERPRSVTSFLQLGWSDDEVSAFTGHVGGGVVARGFVPGRPGDAFGFGVTSVRLAAGGRSSMSGPAPLETSVGGFYRFQLTAWFAVKPDVQVVPRLAASPASRSVVVGTVRFEVGF
jgi:porin